MQSTNGANELRNHVAVIAHASMLAAYAKGLARRAASDQIDLAKVLVRKLANVVLDDLPMCDPGNRPFLRVKAQGRTSITVPLDEGRVTKSPMMSTQGQTSGTRKQLKGSESVFLQLDPPCSSPKRDDSEMAETYRSLPGASMGIADERATDGRGVVPSYRPTPGTPSGSSSHHQSGASGLSRG